MLGGEWEDLLGDLERGFELLRRLPPAVTFFGGARITEDDPYYERSREIGRLLASRGIPPRTGAGPGIMTSVPEGYREASSERPRTGAFAKAMVEGYVAGPETRRLKRHTTQGVKIILPFEPETNPAIERSVDMITFPVRRLMLYENALAIVVFPGGLGTLDELFEVWARRAASLHRDPIILFGGDFFGPLMAALRETMQGPRQLLSAEEHDAVLLTDDPQEVLEAVSQLDRLIGFDEPPEELARRLAREIPYVAGVLSATPAAVTVFGGSCLREGDPALAVAAGVLDALARAQRPVRVGANGATARLAVEAYSRHGRHLDLQGFFLERKGSPPDLPERWAECRQVTVSDPLAHKLLLTQHTTAFLALPGRLQTLDEVFSVLCEMQTGKRPRAPLVLVGADFWRPIFRACEEVMLSGARRTISPEDLDLLRIVDGVDEVIDALGR